MDLSLVSSFLFFELTHFELKYSNLSRLNTLLETQEPPGQYLLLVLLKPLKCQIHKKIKYTQTIVGTIGSETISNNQKPFKNDEKCFLFHVKSSFSQDI